MPTSFAHTAIAAGISVDSDHNDMFVKLSVSAVSEPEIDALMSHMAPCKAQAESACMRRSGIDMKGRWERWGW